MSTWQLTVEVVHVTTEIATVVIGAAGVWIAYQTLLRSPVQRSTRQHAGVGPVAAVDTGIRELVVLDTRKQTTTLRVLDGGVACFLKDKKADLETRQWAFDAAATAQILEERDYRAHAGLRARTGTFSVGPRRNWLYSKGLFPAEEELEHELHRLLQTAVG